jgi:hypothetical protein
MRLNLLAECPKWDRPSGRLSACENSSENYRIEQKTFLTIALVSDR